MDLDNLMQWLIVPADFPLPQDPKKRSESARRVLETRDNVKLVNICKRQGSIRSKLELVVRSYKEILRNREIREVSHILLQEITFKINQH